MLGTAWLFLGRVAIEAATFDIADGNLGALSIAIQQANINGEDDTINLAPEGHYIASGTFSGDDALPTLGPDDNHTLIVNGNGATLRRSTAGGTPNFRLLTTSGTVTINRLIVHNGRLASGSGAGINNFGTLTLNHCIVTGNHIVDGTTVLGGGIMNQANFRLVLNDCIVSVNSVSGTANAHGGGIYNFGTNVNALRVNRSTIAGNMVSSAGGARGGGIYNRGVGTFINSTISGNSANGPNGGGGIYHQSVGEPLALVNTTIANNSAGGGGVGGGIYDGTTAGAGSVSVLNTLIATNTAPTGPDVFSASRPVLSQGHNLIGKTDGSSGWVASDLTGTNAMPLDPMLGALESEFMHPLLAGSPAIEAADDAVLSAPHSLITDQRLVPRATGSHVDIGAFELEPAQSGAAPIVNTTIEHNDGICGVADCTLGEAVAVAEANPDMTTITFQPGVSGVITTRTTPDGLYMINPVIIQGPGARLLTISGSNVSRIFGIDGAGPSVISGLAFVSGRYMLASGGGAIATSTTLAVNNCRFDKNFAGVDGGAIYNIGPLTINKCTFSGNIADGGFGGAIHTFADSFARGNLTATNCTFSGNRAVGGGAVSNKASGRLATSALRNCTVSGNLASLNGTNMGGGLINQGTVTHSRIRLENTIVAANLADDGSPDISGAIVSGGYNLVGNGTGSTGLMNGVNNDQVGTGASPINAQLGSLQDNGGPTDTRALLTSSPAINVGNDALAPVTDQRGYSRSGVSDIGAFEFDGIAPPPAAPVTVVSRKTHGALGPFNIDLLAAAPPFTECRSGGAGENYQVVATFGEAVTVADIAVESSDKMATANANVSGAVATIDLANVANAQTVVITLLEVSNGNSTGDVTITFPVLLGDTNGNGAVTSSDIGQTKAQSGQPVSASNFRTDVNANGAITSSDIGQVKAQSGTQLPP